MLLDAFVREDFRQHLITNLPATFGCERQCRPPELVASLIERAIHEEMAGMLERWLQQGRSADMHWRVPITTIAYMLSWSIFGAAAHDVELVMMEGVARLVETDTAR
jgi:hypothetical protein